MGETVYELRTEVEKGVDSSISIQLIGPGDKSLHEDSFALSLVAFQGFQQLAKRLGNIRYLSE